jgi:hypothetical protein
VVLQTCFRFLPNVFLSYMRNEQTDMRFIPGSNWNDALTGVTTGIT